MLTSVVGYGGLLDAGVGTAVIQHVSQARARNDRAALAEIYGSASAFYLVSGAVLVAVCGVLVPLLGNFLHIAHASDESARAVVVILGASSAIGFAGNVPTASLVGGGRMDRLVLASMPLSLLGRLAQIGVVTAGGGLVALALTTMATGILTLIVTAIIARRTYPDFRISPRTATPRMLLVLLRYGRRNTMVSLAGLVSFNLDQVVIAAVLPLARLAPYAVALRAVNLIRTISAAGTGVLMPAYGHSEALGDKERQFRLLTISIFLSMLVTVPTEIAVVGFGQPLLHLWLGRVPPQTYAVLVALATVFALQLPGHQCVGMLTGAGQNLMIARVGLPMALANLAMSIGATYWLGPIGPAIGSLPQVALFDAVILPWMVCRHLDVPIRRYVLAAILPVVPAAVAAVTTVVLLRLYLHTPGGLVSLAEAAAVVILAWLATIPIASKLHPELARLLHRGS